MRFERKVKSALCGCLASLAAAFLIGCGGGGASTGGGGSTGGSPETLALSASPSSLTVSAGDAFFVTVTASESGTSATPTISLGTLPAGLSTTSTFPMSIPPNGAVVNFTTSSSIAPGNIAVSISGSVGTATASASIPLSVVSGTPVQGFFAIPLSKEVALAQGSSITTQGQFVSTNANSPVYAATLSATGLTPGVTASFSPQVVEGNQSFTVTLTANSAASVVQNAQWNIVATPTANVPPSTSSYLLDVTPAAGGAGWSNQTSYVFTRGTPYSAVYDPAHHMIYAANQIWNRIDVISDKTRTIVKSISIRDPRGMDISVDGSTIWVATGGQVMYGISTATYQATQYILPRYGANSSNPGISWEGAQVFSLADGTVLLILTSYTGSGSTYGAIWNPVTAAFTQTASPATWGAVARSGDGTRVFSFGGDERETSFTYDVSSQTFSKVISLSSFGYAAAASSNQNGSMVAVSTYGTTPFALYDSNMNLIGLLPGDGGVSGAGTFPAENIFGGGFIFGPDGQTIYEETESTAIPLIVSIDAATQQATGLGPAMPVIPVFTELSPPFFMPAPFAVDSAGMLLGIEYEGIAFDDATVHLNYSSSDPGSPIFLQHMTPYSGPLAGGTTSGGFGNGFSQAPDVYYGSTKGSATLSSLSLSITSPPANTPGPVDIKMLFPDGTEVFNPQFFTFGTKIQDAILSGGSPQGGAAAKLDAFGLPLDPSQDTVSVGGNSATVTSSTTQYPPFTGEQTDMYLSYTAPSGNPGWTDLTVTNPNGTSTLPKSFFYAKSVTDYSTTDSPTSVLYDNTRNQLYVSAGNHIDVFSLSSNSFSTPLQPPAVGANKQFQGLALTPDGKYLLAADLTDNTLAVIDPDSPSSAYAVPVATGGLGVGYSCPTGPLFVAADNLGNAYVVTGGVTGTACGAGGYEAVVSLTSKSSTLMKAPGCNVFGQAAYVVSTARGTLIVFGGGYSGGAFQLYVPAQGSCIPAAAPAMPYGVTASADGNVIGLLRAFVSPSGNILGRFAFPEVFYPGATSAVYYNYSPYQDGALQNPALNDAGSLYYWAYPNYVDIVDVRHGTSSLRFGLTETVTNTVSPMAIDSSGQRIFLITDKGLTVVDLGHAPLSVGHFSQTSASAGNQIEIRGSGFENGITATLGGASASLSFTDSETLTLTVPDANAGPEDLILTNPDGTTYTLQNAITVQ